ncbi:MAG TPA: VCBS repeat-containing protein, partial [Candidatus Limnocylindrales bacterium]
MGEAIGARGLHVADLAGDGVPRVVATSALGSGSVWYTLTARSSGYEQDWVSDAYAMPIGSLQVAQMDGDPALEVVLGVGPRILVYDGATHLLQSDFETGAAQVGSLVVADPDGDASSDFVFCASSSWQPGPLFVVDAATGIQEYRGDAFPCTDVAVGNVDDDAVAEIVVGRGSESGFVLDGATHAIEWTNAFGFGDMVRLGDVDGDGRDEVVSGYGWDDIRIFDAELQSLAGSIPVALDLAALRVLDVDGDGDPEILYGDGQWGNLYVHDGATRALLWSVPNPEHGVTDIAVGDADDDGTAELLWGAGHTSTGPDYLYVVDTVSRGREWQSQDVRGPFLALSHGDVDADGRPELLYGSYESDSGYGDGLYFIHDASTHALEYASGPLTGLNWTGLWRLRNANVDADPQQEVFVTTSSTYSGILVCFDGLTHLEQWRREIPSGLTFSSLELADVDQDGQLEAVAGVAVQHTGAPGVFLYVLDAATGAIEWQSPTLASGFANLSLLRVASVDGDSQPEIVLAAYAGAVFLFDRVLGTTQALGDHGVTALDTPDRDGDGVHEIVVGTGPGLIQVLDTAGGVVGTLGTYGGRVDGLAIADLDGNGSHEMVFAVADELFIYAGSGGMLWRSGRSGPPSYGASTVGAQDALRVAALDADGSMEIMVG